MPQINWTNKKANFMGDSLTSGSSAWPAKLGELLGLSDVRNYAVPGAKLSGVSTDTGAMFNMIENMDTDADLVFLFGGGNDWVDGVPIGDKYVVDGIYYLPNLDNETFYGALHVSCQKLINMYPTKRIVLVTMIHSGGDISINSAGHCMLDYVNAVRQVGEWYGIPVLDLWSTIGINPVLVSQQIYMADVLYHLNGLGHKRVAQLAASFIESTLGYEFAEEEIPADQLFFDDFDRTNSGTTLGSEWSAVVGTWGIDNNQAYCVSDAPRDFVLLADEVGVSDYSVSYEFSGDTTDYLDSTYRIPYTIVRYVDSDNYLHADVIQDTIYLWKVDSGVESMLGYAATTGVPTTGGELMNFRVVCQGANIKAKLNDVLFLDFDLDSSDQTKFLSGQKVGFGMDVSGTPDFDLRFDNFRVESLD